MRNHTNFIPQGEQSRGGGINQKSRLVAEHSGELTHAPIQMHMHANGWQLTWPSAFRRARPTRESRRGRSLEFGAGRLRARGSLEFAPPILIVLFVCHRSRALGLVGCNVKQFCRRCKFEVLSRNAAATARMLLDRLVLNRLLLNRLRVRLAVR